MKLERNERQIVHTVLQHMFQRMSDLEEFTGVSLGEPLDTVAKPDALGARLLNVVLWFETAGRVEELIGAAMERAGTNNPEATASLQTVRDAVVERRLRGVGDVVRASETSIGAVRVGLRALTDLLSEPEVKVALAVFRTAFEGADRRIVRLSDYKDLHDALHDLQVRCYAPIAAASRTFPADGTKAQLRVDAIGLRRELRRLRTIATRETLADKDLSWIDDVENAAGLLDEGVSREDAAKVREAALQLRGIVQTQPAWVNTLLVEGAIALDLPRLVGYLRDVARTLEQVGAELTQRQWVEQGATELGRVTEGLELVARSHTAWQKIESLLHVMDESLNNSWDEIRSVWKNVTKRVEKLWVSQDPWAEALQAEARLVSDAIQAQQVSDLATAYVSGFRASAINRFYEVDKDLKALCEQIRPVGRDLERLVTRLSQP